MIVKSKMWFGRDASCRLRRGSSVLLVMRLLLFVWLFVILLMGLVFVWLLFGFWLIVLIDCVCKKRKRTENFFIMSHREQKKLLWFSNWNVEENKINNKNIEIYWFWPIKTRSFCLIYSGSTDWKSCVLTNFYLMKMKRRIIYLTCMFYLILLFIGEKKKKNYLNRILLGDRYLRPISVNIKSCSFENACNNFSII